MSLYFFFFFFFQFQKLWLELFFSSTNFFLSSPWLIYFILFLFYFLPTIIGFTYFFPFLWSVQVSLFFLSFGRLFSPWFLLPLIRLIDFIFSLSFLRGKKKVLAVTYVLMATFKYSYLSCWASFTCRRVTDTEKEGRREEGRGNFPGFIGVQVRGEEGREGRGDGSLSP